MNERIKKGYSFIYVKGMFNGCRINKEIICIDTDEIFELMWE